MRRRRRRCSSLLRHCSTLMRRSSSLLRRCSPRRINNKPEIPLSINGIQTKLSGESAFVLMSLLGATLVLHNFYLHSSIVQWHQGSTTISKDALCHSHFLAIICVFNGLYLVNNVLMNAAANEFYSMGLVLTTFQEALSPMEQVLCSPIALLGVQELKGCINYFYSLKFWWLCNFHLL